jgi:3-oxoacyl-[acyl-carrier protein] reductase
MELQDAVAIVTGGTGGLGQRICRAFAVAGAHVAGIYQTSQAQAEAQAAEWSALGPRCAAFQADVTDPDSIRQIVERVLVEFGRIDILVNNAAYNQADQILTFRRSDSTTGQVLVVDSGRVYH